MSGNIAPPVLEKTPLKNKMAEAMGTLGMLTMSCELGDPTKKSVCQDILIPLEQGKETAVDTMTKMIVEFGPEVLDEAMDGLNMIVFEAATRAKEQLIAQGKLNPDGTPVE